MDTERAQFHNEIHLQQYSLQFIKRDFDTFIKYDASSSLCEEPLVMKMIQYRVMSFTSFSILIKAFWVMTLYQFVNSFRRYLRASCFHLQSSPKNKVVYTYCEISDKNTM